MSHKTNQIDLLSRLTHNALAVHIAKHRQAAAEAINDGRKHEAIQHLTQVALTGIELAMRIEDTETNK